MSSQSDRLWDQNNNRKEFKRQAPIEEFDDVDELPEIPCSDQKIGRRDDQKRVRTDPDGTEYEWDESARGWFPKISDNYLVEHHLNYGSFDNKFKFNADLNCYTYSLEDGTVLRLEISTNQWVPLDAVIETIDGVPSFWHPQLNIRFILRLGRYEPAEISNYVDNKTGINYIWSREHNCFVDERSLSRYVDVVTCKTFHRNPNNEWEADELVVGELPVQQAPVAGGNEETRSNQGWLSIPDEKNRNVYVSNIPSSMTDQEFYDLMSKYGLIAVDTDRNNQPRIKLYKDEQGKNKGDGLCTFVKVESVELCLKLLDGSAVEGSVIRAERAQFEPKGTFDPNKRRRKKQRRQAKSKINQKLFGWDEGTETKPRAKTDRILVLRNIISEDNQFMPFAEVSAVKSAIRNLFKSCAPVKDVRVFPATGVVTVGLNSPQEADACLEYVNGRLWTNGRTIECCTWDGKTKFDTPCEDQSAVDDQSRVQQWHEFLTKEDGNN